MGTVIIVGVSKAGAVYFRVIVSKPGPSLFCRAISFGSTPESDVFRFEVAFYTGVS